MDKIREMFHELFNRVENLEKGISFETLEIPSDGIGYLAIPALATDPTPTVAGQIWFNTTSSQLKVYNGTAIKAVTLA